MTQLQPFQAGLDRRVEDMMGGGMSMRQVRTAYSTAIEVQRPRSLDLEQIHGCVMREFTLAADSAFYSWTVESKKTGLSLISGPSYEGAMIFARNWRNCAIEVDVVGETGSEWTLKAALIDLETGFTAPRLFRQRKAESHGAYDTERSLDIAFQIGQSKAIRNSILACMPGYWVEEAVQVAMRADEKKRQDVQRQLPQFVVAFGAIGISLQQMERRIVRKSKDWRPCDLALLAAIGRAIKAGETNIVQEFPGAQFSGAVATPEPEKAVAVEPSVSTPAPVSAPVAAPEPTSDPAPAAASESATEDSFPESYDRNMSTEEEKRAWAKRLCAECEVAYGKPRPERCAKCNAPKIPWGMGDGVDFYASDPDLARDAALRVVEEQIKSDLRDGKEVPTHPSLLGSSPQQQIIIGTACPTCGLLQYRQEDKTAKCPKGHIFANEFEGRTVTELLAPPKPRGRPRKDAKLTDVPWHPIPAPAPAPAPAFDWEAAKRMIGDSWSRDEATAIARDAVAHGISGETVKDFLRPVLVRIAAGPKGGK